MDNLLANYASSDEEEEEQQQQRPPKPPSFTSSLPPPKSSLFNSLPPPKSSLLNSLPPSKSPQTLTNPTHQDIDPQNQQLLNSEYASQFGKTTSKPSSSLFSSLPPPKSHNSDSPPSSILSSSTDTNTKRVVQFKLPINPFSKKSSKVDDDDDGDDEEEEEKQRKRAKDSTQTPTVTSFLSSIPAPKNSVTLGALPSALGLGRRSILEADVPALRNNGAAVTEVRVESNVESYEGQWVDGSSTNDYSGGDSSNWVSAGESYVNYDTSGGYGNYGHYESNWVDRSAATAVSDVPGIPEYVLKVPGKRGRVEVPQEIVEVKQDELIKNRPREDQVKITGIAFGPSYQPASTKGKPTKLHKRKHQIGSLLYDMKQKEMELAERRAKGFLTKAETQAKYGW